MNDFKILKGCENIISAVSQECFIARENHQPNEVSEEQKKLYQTYLNSQTGNDVRLG